MRNHLLSISLAAFFVCVIVSLLGCQKAPELTLTSPANVELSVDGSSGSITFTANRDWRVNCSDPWVSVSPSSGPASDGPVTVTVRCGANTTYDDRTATVTITMEGLSQTVTVKQPANLGIIIPTQLYNVAPESKTIEVEVQANVQYNVTISADWIKQVGAKGLTTNKLTFNIEENKTYDERSATITISGSGISQFITVKQSGKEKPKVPDGAVDLGLSVYWASCNLGASSQEEYGDYYTWGEIETYYVSQNPMVWKDDKGTGYNWGSYKWSTSTGSEIGILLKYNTNSSFGQVDNKEVLELEDDIANVKLGGKWRMPSKDEINELISNCTWKWTTQNGRKGYSVTCDSNGESIFLPAAGSWAGWYNFGVDNSVEYWSSSLHEDINYPHEAYRLAVGSMFEIQPYILGDTDCYPRCYGLPIRPVCEK